MLERILLLAGDLALNCGVEAVGLSLRLAPCGSGKTKGLCSLLGDDVTSLDVSVTCDGR